MENMNNLNMNEAVSVNEARTNPHYVVPAVSLSSMQAKAMEYKAQGLSKDQAIDRMVYIDFREYPPATVIAIVSSVYG